MNVFQKHAAILSPKAFKSKHLHRTVSSNNGKQPLTRNQHLNLEATPWPKIIPKKVWRIVKDTRLNPQTSMSTSSNTEQAEAGQNEALTEPEDTFEKDSRGDNSNNEADLPNESREKTDLVVRFDPNESLKNLINRLEGSTDGLESLENGN